jgi:hypothetical protein
MATGGGSHQITRWVLRVGRFAALPRSLWKGQLGKGVEPPAPPWRSAPEVRKPRRRHTPSVPTAVGRQNIETAMPLPSDVGGPLMNNRTAFTVLSFLLAIALLLILINLVLGTPESASTVLNSLTSLLAAAVPFVAAVKGVTKESKPEPQSRQSPQSAPTSFPSEVQAPTVAMPDGDTRSEAAEPTATFTLGRSFEAGVYGGLIGGAIAGLALALAYGVNLGRLESSLNLSTARLIAEIFVTGCLCGVLIGALTQFGVHWFRYRRETNRTRIFLQNEVVGGMLFGAAAGVVAGPIVALFFGPRPIRMIDGGLLIAAAVVGAVSLPAGALFYDFRGNLRFLLRAFLICAVVTALVLIPVAAGLYSLNIFDWFYTEDVGLYAVAGGIIGGALTAAVGAEVGATQLLYRLWREAETTP